MYKCSREKGERANKPAPGRAGSGAHRWCPALFPALGLGVLSTACPALPPRAPVQFIPAQLLAKFLLVTQWQPQGLNVHVPLLAKNTWIPPWTNHHSSTHGQSWTETLIFPNGNFSVVGGKTLLYFFFLFNFIHELKWLWAVTNQFFTVFWTDGCSKNTSILAVSNSLDLPKQRCRLFVRRKEVKNHSHSPNFFLDY